MLRYVLLASLVGLLTLLPGQAQGVATPRERFLSEAPRKWAEYQTRGKCLQGSCLVTALDRMAGGKVLSKVLYECKQNDTCSLALIQDLGDTPKTRKGRVEVVNSRYAFRLERSSPDRPWVLAGINRHLDGGYDLGALTPDVRVAGIFVDKAMTFSSIHECLPNMMQDPDFVIKDATLVMRDGQECVRLDFTNRPKLTAPRQTKLSTIRGGWNPVSGGWVLLDSARYWVFCEFDIQTEWQDHSRGKMTARCTYKDGKNGLPILSRILVNYQGTTAQGSRLETEGIHEYNLTEQPDMSEREFTLSAFGLPEPAGLEWQRPTPWYLWIGLAGIVCLALAVGIYRFRQRTTASRR